MNTLSLLLEITLKGSVLLAFAGFTLSLWRNASAATRHMIWLLSLIGALALPLLTAVIPDWRIAPEHTLSWASDENAQGYQPLGNTGPQSRNQTSHQMAETAMRESSASGNNTPSMSTILLLAWLGGMAVVMLYLAAGILRTCRFVRRACSPASAIVRDLMQKLLPVHRLERSVTVAVSGSSSAPFVWGWRKPVIMLPDSAHRWSAHRLEMVLAHELAHVRRNDNVTGLIGWLAVAVNWFNPLVWLAMRRLRTEQERACDDHVLGQGVSAPDYAEQLLDISLSVSIGRGLGLQTPFTRKSQLGERLMAILKLNRHRAPLSIGRTALLSLLMAAAVLPLAALADRQPVQLDGVTPAQREAITATLSGFYDALNSGEDYQNTCGSYLATGYFAPPGLTKENLEEGVWTAAFQNTLDIFTKSGVYGSMTAHDRIKSIRHVGERFIATLELNLTGDAYQIESIQELPDGIRLETVNDPVTGKPLMAETYLAKTLEHEVIFTIENGGWKISRYDGPIGIKRMDVDNPYGPIFLVWLEDVGAEMTPYGQMISKIIPNEYRPFNNVGIEFKLES